MNFIFADDCRLLYYMFRGVVLFCWSSCVPVGLVLFVVRDVWVAFYCLPRVVRDVVVRWVVVCCGI